MPRESGHPVFRAVREDLDGGNYWITRLRG
jgi:hypothetical protein